MNWLSKIKESPHYEKLKASVQYRHDRRQVLVFGCMAALLLLILVPLMIAESQTPYNAATSAVFVPFLILIMLVYLLYIIFCWLRIFLYIDQYVFREVVLDRPHIQSNGRHSATVRFTVTLTDRYGKEIERDTDAMFSSNSVPVLEEYNNKKVLVGYNEKTDRLIVIGLVSG